MNPWARGPTGGYACLPLLPLGWCTISPRPVNFSFDQTNRRTHSSLDKNPRRQHDHYKHAQQGISSSADPFVEWANDVTNAFARLEAEACRKAACGVRTHPESTGIRSFEPQETGAASVKGGGARDAALQRTPACVGARRHRTYASRCGPQNAGGARKRRIHSTDPSPSSSDSESSVHEVLLAHMHRGCSARKFLNAVSLANPAIFRHCCPFEIKGPLKSCGMPNTLRRKASAASPRHTQWLIQQNAGHAAFSVIERRPSLIEISIELQAVFASLLVLSLVTPCSH